MPFWQRETEADKKQRERQEASIKALEMGRLPINARHRLEEAAKLRGKFFTSDLTVNESLVAREAGYESLGLVMGSCFYKVGFWGTFRRALAMTGELTELTQAQTAARDLCVKRLRDEAKLLGAHGVIGVRLQARTHEWASGLVEFTAVGTAIRVPDREPTDEPFTSDLSGQDFWQLHRAGYWPKGLAFGVCTYYVNTSPETRNITQPSFLPGRWTANQEVRQYTQSYYHAGELARRRLKEDIRRIGAEGAVGMVVQQRIEDIEYESSNVTYHDLLIHFVTVGTAVVRDNTPPAEPAKGPLMFMDLQTGRTRSL